MTDEDALWQLVAAGREAILARVDSDGRLERLQVTRPSGVIPAGGRRPIRRSEAGGA